VQLSAEALSLRRSLLRDLIGVSARPGMISFAGGLPAPELFPTEAWAECTARVLANDGPRALQYGPPFRPLQEEIAGLMAGWGAPVAPDQVFITTGAQQALHVLGRLLMDADSAVVLDEVVFPGIRQAFGGFAREVREVPTGVAEGLDLDAVAAALGRGPRPRAIVVVPEFHNPLGTSLADAARARLVAEARAAGVPIVEDDPYRALRFGGQPSRPIVARAPESTFYVGSFSKMVAPALRLGWIVGPLEIVDRLRVLKESVDLETSQLTQRVAAAFLAGGHLEGHLARARAAHRERLAVMLGALARHLPAGSRWSVPEGGIFVWAELPEGTETGPLLAAAIEAGVCFVPGLAFGPHGAARAMRLNFSNASPERIEAGMAALGRVLDRAPALLTGQEAG